MTASDPEVTVCGTGHCSSCAQVRREETFELQAIRLREQVDAQRRQIAALEAEARAACLEAVRAVRQRDAASADAAARIAAAHDDECARDKEHARELREQRAAAAAKYRALQREGQEAAVLAGDCKTGLQAEITNLERALGRARAALRAGTKEVGAAQAALDAELQRARDERMHSRAWARVQEEETRRRRAEEERCRLQNEVDRLLTEASGRSQQAAAEKHELYYLRHRVKELEAKVASYQVRSNRKFFEVEPIAEENEQLRAQLAEQVTTLGLECTCVLGSYLCDMWVRTLTLCCIVHRLQRSPSSRRSRSRRGSTSAREAARWRSTWQLPSA